MRKNDGSVCCLFFHLFFFSFNCFFISSSEFLLCLYDVLRLMFSFSPISESLISKKKTSIQCSGSAPATVSVLLQVLHQVHGFLYRTHRMLYIHFRNRPIQSISQQQSLEAHKRILPLPVVWLIPCGSYGQCLSQPF